MISKIILSVTFLFSVSRLACCVSNTPSPFDEELSLVQDDVEEADLSSLPWAPTEEATDSDVSTPDDPEETTETHSQSCLTLESAKCVDMETLNISKVMIGITTPEEQSVTSCVNLCSERRLGTSVVYAVWITSDPQRLFCGCDNSQSGRLVSEDLCSVRCPGDGRRCGAYVNKVLSVYILLGDVEARGGGNPNMCSATGNDVTTTSLPATPRPSPPTPPPLFSLASPTNLPPELPPASDFEFLGCFSEDSLLYDDMMYIEHVDHQHRSVSSCFLVCKNLHPLTSVVYTKIIEMNERLVCGCDTRSKDLFPVGRKVESTYCNEKCPDGGGSCGSLTYKVVSAYSEPATSGAKTSGRGASGEATSGRSWCALLGAFAVVTLRFVS